MAVKKKMNVVFKDEEEYQKYKSGKTHSDKGLRTEDGKLSSLPDIEELEEGEVILVQEVQRKEPVIPVQEVQRKEPGLGEQIVYSLLEGLYEATKDFLSDEENRKAIATLAKNWWNEKALPGIKKSVENVKTIAHGVKTGETKAEKLMETKKNKADSSIIATSGLTEKKEKRQKNKISAEEYQQQIKQVQVLAVLLADRIKKLSNSVIDENNMTDEEYVLQEEEIKELTTDEIMNTIKLLVDTDGFALDDSTKQLFSEFILGNLIVNNECIPIEVITGRREKIERKIER